MRVIQLVLVLILVAGSFQLRCDQKDTVAANGTNKTCSKCNIYCMKSFTDSCGVSLCKDQVVNFVQSEGSVDNLIFVFKEKFNNITNLNIQGNGSNLWPVTFMTDLVDQEVVITGGQINISQLTSFESQNLKYAMRSDSNLSLFNISGVGQFLLSGNVFDSQYFGSNLTGSLINSSNSNIVLESVNLIGLTYNSYYRYLIQMRGKGSLTMKGDVLTISNIQNGREFIIYAYGNNKINIQVEELRVTDNTGRFIYLQSASDKMHSTLTINASRSILISNNTKSYGYGIPSFFFICGSTASIFAKEQITISSNKDNQSPLFYTQKAPIINIESEGKIEFLNNLGSLFERSRFQIQKPFSLLLKAPSLRFDKNEQLFESLGNTKINFESTGTIELNAFKNLSKIFESQFFVRSPDVLFIDNLNFINVHNATFQVEGQKSILIQNPKAKGKIFIQHNQSATTNLLSGGMLTLDQYFEKFLDLNISNTVLLQAQNDIQVNLKNDTVACVLLTSQSNNNLKLSAPNGSIIFSSKNSNFKNTQLFNFNFEGNSVEVQASQDIKITGLSETLPAIAPTELSLKFLVTNSNQNNKLLISASQSIYFENIINPGGLFYFLNNPTSLTSPQQYTLKARDQIIFKNIIVNKPLIHLSDSTGALTLESEGNIEFSDIKTTDTGFYQNQNNKLQMLSTKGKILFQNIYGYPEKPLTKLFNMELLNCSLSIQANDLVSFVNITSLKLDAATNDETPNCFLIAFNQNNQTLELKSEEGVIVDRPGKDLDYQVLDQQTPRLDIEWVYPEKGKFSKCLQDCQLCGEQKTCQKCRQGSSLSPDKTQCNTNKIHITPID